MIVFLSPLTCFIQIWVVMTYCSRYIFELKPPYAGPKDKPFFVNLIAFFGLGGITALFILVYELIQIHFAP